MSRDQLIVPADKKAAQEEDVQRIEDQAVSSGVNSTETPGILGVLDKSAEYSDNRLLEMLQEAKRGENRQGERIDAETRETQLNYALSKLRPELVGAASSEVMGIKEAISDLRHEVKQAVLSETDHEVADEIAPSHHDPPDDTEDDEDEDEETDEFGEPQTAHPAKKRPRGQK